jgi:hypothetical protein
LYSYISCYVVLSSLYRWGAHCIDAWLGADPSRWDIISYQFGLHDLALDNERVEPDTAYATYLTNITARLATAAPQAKISWVTTTPVPEGIDGYCNKTNGEGGCPPRRATDPPIYNAAAARVVAAHNMQHDGAPIGTIDLYAVATRKCGTSYSLCPANCTGSKVNGSWVGSCYQIPHNVHFFPAGWADLSKAYMSAADGV